MSGHVVMAPVLFPAASAVLGGAAIAAVAGSLACSVKQAVDLQIEAAQARAAEEKERMAERSGFRQWRQQRLESFREVESAVHETERRLAAMGLSGPQLRPQGGPGGGPAAPAARAYMTVGSTRVPPEMLEGMLRELAETLDNLPAAFREAKHSPHARLVEQKERLFARFAASGSIEMGELEAFHQMIGLTVRGFLTEEQTRRELEEAVHLRLEKALDDILFHEHLAASPNLPLQEQLIALGSLKEQVRTLLENRGAKLGPLETIEKRLAALKAAIGACVVETAHRRGLCDSITVLLEDMGYETLEAFPADAAAAMLPAALRIPGGEQVRIALHRNNQIGFQVVHERFGHASELDSLTDDELVVLHTQETRWCNDFKTLVRRLVEQGFGYEVSFEGAIQDSAIKVVVVETPEDVLSRNREDEDMDDAPQRRYFS